MRWMPFGVGLVVFRTLALVDPVERRMDFARTNVVDIHAVFPDFTRDPEKPANYGFGRTDEYLATVRQAGAQIIYRLGETIEHNALKHHVHPPSDPQE